MVQVYVIAKGFMGEPKQLAAIDWNDERVLVAPPFSRSDLETVDNVLSLPRASVFEWDAGLFERLSVEWNLTGSTAPKSWRGVKLWAGRAYAEA